MQPPNTAHIWPRNGELMTIQALYSSRTRGGHLLPPGRPMFEHRIDDGQQFTHAGH
jgi:hypothetical protein